MKFGGFCAWYVLKLNVYQELKLLPLVLTEKFSVKLFCTVIIVTSFYFKISTGK